MRRKRYEFRAAALFCTERELDDERRAATMLRPSHCRLTTCDAGVGTMLSIADDADAASVTAGVNVLLACVGAEIERGSDELSSIVSATRGKTSTRSA